MVMGGGAHLHLMLAPLLTGCAHTHTQSLSAPLTSQAPTPWIMGVHSSYASGVPDDLDDALLVNLDKNTVTTSEPVPALPDPGGSCCLGGRRRMG